MMLVAGSESKGLAMTSASRSIQSGTETVTYVQLTIIQCDKSKRRHKIVILRDVQPLECNFC